MAQALADLFALVGEPEVQQAGPPEQQAVADGAIVLAELEDLQQIATADADRAQARKYNRRSWELMKHARDRREVHIRTRKTDAETAKRRRAEQKLQLVAASQPGSSSVLGIRQQSSTPQQLAAIHVSIACKPRIRGKASEHFAKRQDRSLSLVPSVVASSRLSSFRTWWHLCRAMLDHSASSCSGFLGVLCNSTRPARS